MQWNLDSTTGHVSLFNTDAFWNLFGTSVIGSTFQFNYYHDSTAASDQFVFGISQWQMPNVPVSDGNGTNRLAAPSDIHVSVDGTNIPNAVVDLNPILGHVTLQSSNNFWILSPLGRILTIGDQISFSYYQSGNNVYSMLFDDIARNLDDNMLLDGPEGVTDIARDPAARIPVLEIGYKYRADLLHHASVLNSPDTLLLNNYQKPANRASIVNRQDNLNHFNYFFSPEHLYDTDSNIILDDQYLDKPNDPILKLHEGTPPFQKTFSSQPHLVHQRKLQDIRKHHSLLMYSALLLKEFRTGESVPLSSICDQGTVSFKFRFKEDLTKIKECESWILFDTSTNISEQITIPSNRAGVINLRVPTKKLRRNFILRETAPTNVTQNIYTEVVPAGSSKTVFYMPETIRYNLNGEYIDFPALPIYKDYYTLATAADIIVLVNGSPVTVSSLDPINGIVTLVSPVGVSATDTVSFIYNFRSINSVDVLDQDRSRVLDYNQVLPGGCFDGYDARVHMRVNEYINFLSDDGQGIKFKYFNKDTQQIEEHVFNGPVFETYEAQEDEISAFESFPGALVRIRSPIDLRNPLNGLTDYRFLEEPAVRIRKKTIRELMPDRTFRTFKIVEALPV